ncbi:IBR finger domain protein [Fusarium subglutinans]|uniref:IBR finger domain protein n=1 Tax=Gibberella subglutinans TaxID=42677 RepID=A0A8H5P2R1_GIBSU|nr:IBR finger domain protein [Fusarium subglutinans]KAF5587634.1 IBR finger domain protein [Fusarium subglutinans]
MDTSSLMLALQLQQQDLNNWEQSRKGKQREGEVSDSDLALEACRHELQAMAAQISDQAMALSIARAVESDGQIIREAQLAEQQAARDHEYAVSLSNNPNANPRSLARSVKNTHKLENEVEDDLIDILRSMNLGGLNDATSGQPESSGWAASRKAPQMKECIACNDRFSPLALSRSPCSHEYCRECIVGLVRSSLQDETLFPPRCCGQNIPVTPGRWFSPELVGQFQAKKLEFDTPNRTYCSKPSCSTFVPPQFIAGETATCPRCRRRTCVHCKGPHHSGVCPSDTASQQILELAAENGWQRCYACHRVVELEIGCNHMKQNSATFVASLGRIAAAPNGKKSG